MKPPAEGGYAGGYMDTSSYVYIGLAAATGVGTVVWFWIRRIQMGLDANAQSLNGKANHNDVEALKDELHANQLAMNTQFKRLPTRVSEDLRI